jgi:hypothetical protein
MTRFGEIAPVHRPAATTSGRQRLQHRRSQPERLVNPADGSSAAPAIVVFLVAAAALVAVVAVALTAHEA